MARTFSTLAALLVFGTLATSAHADERPEGLVMKAATEDTPKAFYGSFSPAQLFVFGPAPAPRIVLFPRMQILRPADIPPPKPTKGLGLAFDW